MATERMSLTGAQRDAIKHPGHAMVVACPGSGKTRTLIAKLIRCLDQVRGTPRRIACITYTNAAVYVISQRVREFGSLGDEHFCDISTIHSFCLENILRPFHWMSPAVPRGFSVLPPDSARYQEIAGDVVKEYGLSSKTRDQFELLNRDVTGDPIVSSLITVQAAREFWNRLENEGYIDFPNIIYYSYRLLLEEPGLAHYIACRYSWILVDEFQDTSTLQVAIFRIIAERNRTQFFLVGDPYQSIYGFAGARRDLMTSFAETLGAEDGFKLLHNFRSGPRIIEHAERLCPRTPPMVASGPYASCVVEPLYVHASSVFEAIWDGYLPRLGELGIRNGDAAILAPWWVTLFHLGRQLRDRGVSIVGPGARPYKRNHLFATLAEQICEYIERPDPELIPIIERELFNLVTRASARPDFRVFSHEGRATVVRLIRTGTTLKGISGSAQSWLKNAGSGFSDILVQDGFLSENCKCLLPESVDGMLSDIQRNEIDPDELTVADLGMFARSKLNLKLLTMHHAKGREFEAVAIIDLHDGKVPHYSVTTDAEREEARRLLYVAMTRAKRLLMYVTDNSHPRNRPSPFLLEDGLALSPRRLTTLT